MLKKQLSAAVTALLIILFATGLTSCSTKGDEPGEPDLFYDIATLVASNSSGSIFSVIPEDDRPAVKITFPGQMVDTQTIPVGTRCLIIYVPDGGKAYVDDSGVLYALGYVYNGEITVSSAEETSLWKTERQNLISVWRSGNWINLQTECTYDQNYPTVYKLIVDATTLDNEIPHAYLIYEADDSSQADTKVLFSSFNIESVWNNENVKGLEVTILTNNGTENFTFKK